MNIIWIIADTLRLDGLACYGNTSMRTPFLDHFAQKAVKFEKHYAASFPTMPARADFFTGRWTFTYMAWEPLYPNEVTLAQILSEQDYHTAAIVDTPFYQRFEMNYDRGFQTFVNILGQHARGPGYPHHEAYDVRAGWRYEGDRNAPRTMLAAQRWLEDHYTEKFFLYIDTWDPHEPWDAPAYYTERYYPNYDGELIYPAYAYWQEIPWLTAEKVKKAYATYCGEITLVDRWVGDLLNLVETMNLLEDTCVIFTTDHGFCFGEHGGFFGKQLQNRRQDGTLIPLKELPPGVEGWRRIPLYEEIAHIPLLIYIPTVEPHAVSALTSAIDLMPTVLDLTEVSIPKHVRGTSLVPLLTGKRATGREFVISSPPLAPAGEVVRQVDGFARPLFQPPYTTITTSEWSLMYSVAGDPMELYHLATDPVQEDNVIEDHWDIVKQLHQMYVSLLRECKVRPELLEPRYHLK